MISWQEALNIVLSSPASWGEEEKALEQCLNAVSADALPVREDQPPFDNSAMDGYALNIHDIDRKNLSFPLRFPVTGEIQAGGPVSAPVVSGTAVKIMTGARMPEGADTVVPVEDGHEENGFLILDRFPETGRHIRRQGESFRKGDRLLEAGQLLNPAALALCSSQGLEKIRVCRRPRIRVLITGNEVNGGTAEGGIRDSNGPFLKAFLARLGFSADIQHVGDSYEDVKQSFIRAFEEADLIISSGGVSMGDYDFVRPVLTDIGADLRFTRVAQKPGKPMTFAEKDGKQVFALPGNPGAVMMTSELYIKAFLMKNYYKLDKGLTIKRLILNHELKNRSNRVYFRWGMTDEKGRLTIPEGQESYQIHHAARADVLVIVDRSESGYGTGAELPCLPLSWRL